MRFTLSSFNQAGIYYGHGTDNAWDEAVALVMQILHLPSEIDISLLNSALVQSEKDALVDAIQRRVVDKQPLPYITHRAWFCDLEFYVDDRVLIPRSPIAELIQSEFLPWYSSAKPVEHVLDLCTGSGCIAIACAYAFADAYVDAVDLSDDALAVAQINIERHQLESQVQLFQGDLFENVPKGRRYDIIVSNPPYVDADDMAALPAEYIHEPEMALAAGDDGLDIVKRILQQAAQFLTPDGILVIEVGNSEHALAALMPQVPFIWLDFEQGGHGVFVLTAAEICACQSIFDEF